MKLLWCFPVLIILSACSMKEKETPEALAHRYCSACHMFPEPSLLDKKSWRDGVLPQMAFRMGIDKTLLWQTPMEDMEAVLKTLPREAMVTQEQWDAIRDYFISAAPDSLPVEPVKTSNLTQFKIESHFLDQYPAVTLLQYDEDSKNLLVGTRQNFLYRIDKEFRKIDSIKLDSPPSSAIVEVDHEIISTMGIMDPNDQRLGKILRIINSPTDTTMLIDSLKRPVDIQQIDLNEDGLSDLVISEFGNYSGALSVYEGDGRKYKRHIVHTLPGTRRTVCRDFNGDGRTDLLTLITQGDEKIVLYINTGNFQFEPRELMRFPPAYGSSYFDLADFNNDGHDDILYTNGDNADFSSILKPYHGIRIFLNKGDFTFTQQTFIHLDGASKAMAHDFDGDGDLDIAAISFFPNFKKQPETGFVYLQNTNGSFEIFTTPAAANARWLTMTTADIDGDSDMDVILGALNFPSMAPPAMRDRWNKQKISLLLLRNQLK